jgi:hypothetical protein
MTNEKIILQLEKGYDIKNPQLAQVLTNIENNGVTKEEFTEAMETKADLVGGKVPAEQLPSYVDDVIEFESIINGSSPINFYLNNQSYTDKVYYIQGSTSIEGTLSFKYNKKFINFGTNTSEDDWIIVEPEEGKIYIKIGSGNDSNHSFRWSGSDLIDLDKNWSDRINTLEFKTMTSNLGTITNPLDLSESTSTSSFTQLYRYLSQRNKSSLINLLWYYNGATYSSPIIDVDPIERTFAIYNQGYLQTYKVLKEDDNYSLVKVKEFPDFVYLDYSTVGSVLDDNTIERIRNASIVLVNSNLSMPNIKYIYNVKLKTNTYLQFIRVSELSNSEDQIVYQDLSVNIGTKKWTIATKKYTLPYGAYTSFGFTGKSSVAVNQEVARLVNMNSYNITSSDLNKVHSGDKLENIKNATFLILNEGGGKTKIFTRGYTSASTIYYNCVNNSGSANYILLKTGSNLLSSVEQVSFDDIAFSNYINQGGTKTNKSSMYKELAAQLTENTYVIDSSKLNTVLTDTEASSVQNATTLIISNSNTNNLLVFKRGYIGNEEIYFTNINLVSGGSLSISRIIYNTTTKTCSNIALSIVDPYVWYIGNGGDKSNKNDFININKVLYNNTYIIDKTLLNTTISDTAIQNGIKKANILVVKDSTDSNYKVHIKGFVTSNMIYFFNLQNANADNITATRVLFNTTTNLLNSADVYLQSAFNAYKLGGGTKYTTETAFNTAFAAAIDAYTSTI